MKIYFDLIAAHSTIHWMDVDDTEYESFKKSDISTAATYVIQNWSPKDHVDFNNHINKWVLIILIEVHVGMSGANFERYWRRANEYIHSLPKKVKFGEAMIATLIDLEDELQEKRPAGYETKSQTITEWRAYVEENRSKHSSIRPIAPLINISAQPIKYQ